MTSLTPTSGLTPTTGLTPAGGGAVFPITCAATQGQLAGPLLRALLPDDPLLDPDFLVSPDGVPTIRRTVNHRSAATQAQAAATPGVVKGGGAVFPITCSATQAQAAVAALVKNPAPVALPQITQAPASMDAPLALGCGYPRVEIWTRGLDARVLELPEIIDASYGYMLGDTSLGECTMSAAFAAIDARCSTIGIVKPWIHELVIYRDDVLAWSGPITEMVMSEDTFVIKARDVSAWLDHRVIHETHIYGGQGVGQGSTDTTVIFGDLITDAMAPDTSPNLALSLGLPSGVLAQGNYTPGSFKLVGPLIRELAKGSIDWYVKHRTLFYTGGGAAAAPPGGGSATDVTAASISNPGFETNTAGWAVNGFNALVRTTSKFHAGAASCTITVAQVPETVTATLTNLIVGKSYTVRGWFLGDLAAGPYSQDTHMEVAGVKSANFSYQIYVAAPNTWYQASVTFKATSSSHTLTIYDRRPSGTATFYFDDFTLTLNNPDLPPPPPPPPTDPVLVLPLSDDDLRRPATITLAGLNQETRSIVSNQQAGGDVAFYGEAPAPGWTLDTTGPGLTTEQLLYGLLEGSVTSTLSDEAGAQAQASQRSTLLAPTPVVLDGFVLSKDARVAFARLLPGVLIEVRLDRPCLTVEQTLIIRQVQVKATPTDEEVTLILEPSGQES